MTCGKLRARAGRVGVPGVAGAVCALLLAGAAAACGGTGAGRGGAEAGDTGDGSKPRPASATAPASVAASVPDTGSAPGAGERDRGGEFARGTAQNSAAAPVPGSVAASARASGSGSAPVSGRPPGEAAARQRKAQTATASYVCMGTKGSVKLTATAGGRPGVVRFSLVASRFTTPVRLAAGEVKATLTLSRTGGDGPRTAVFRGSNPRLAAGDRVRLGPLTGRVERGDRLDSYRADGKAAVRMSYGPLKLACHAKSVQKPGPFTF